MTTLEPIFRARRLLAVFAALLLWSGANAGAQALFVTKVEGQYQQLPFGKPSEEILITGGGFVQGSTAVYFNNTLVSSLYVSSADGKSMNVVIRAGTPAGIGAVHVSNLTSQAYGPDFEVIGSAPFIFGFSPIVGGPGEAVDVNVINRNAATSVQIGGVPASWRIGDIENSIQAFVPNAPRSGLITITSAFGNGSSKSNFFAPAAITNFSPYNGIVGTPVQIQGVNFLGATAVRFANGVSASLADVSNTNLTTIVQAGARTGPIFISTPAGGMGSSSNFVIPPSISSFSPPGGPVNSNVSVTGTTFFDVTSVKIGSTAAGNFVAHAAGTNLTFPVPDGAVTGPIIITTTSGSVTSAVPFYLPPQITGVNPIQGRADTNVALTGMNFTGATNVTFDGVNAAFSNATSNALTAVVPTGALTGSLVVRTPGGAATNALFKIQPLITGFNPTSGFPGTLVTITGTNFTPAPFSSTPTVRFYGSNAMVTSFTLTQIIAIVPTNITSGMITVTTDGGSDESMGTFTVLSINTNIVLSLRLTNSQAVVSWTTDSDGFGLQSTTNLSLPWSSVAGPTSLLGGQFIVTNSTAASNQFFRLLRP